MPIDREPGRTVVAPDGKYLYVSNKKDTKVYGTSSNELSWDVVNAISPQVAAFTSDSKWAFIPNYGTSTVSVASNADKTFWTQISLPHGIRADIVAVNKALDGKEYAYAYSETRLVVIDKGSLEAMASLIPINMFQRDNTLAFSEDGS